MIRRQSRRASLIRPDASRRVDVAPHDRDMATERVDRQREYLALIIRQMDHRGVNIAARIELRAGASLRKSSQTLDGNVANSNPFRHGYAHAGWPGFGKKLGRFGEGVQAGDVVAVVVEVEGQPQQDLLGAGFLVEIVGAAGEPA